MKSNSTNYAPKDIFGSVSINKSDPKTKIKKLQVDSSISFHPRSNMQHQDSRNRSSKESLEESISAIRRFNNPVSLVKIVKAQGMMQDSDDKISRFINQ